MSSKTGVAAAILITGAIVITAITAAEKQRRKKKSSAARTASRITFDLAVQKFLLSVEDILVFRLHGTYDVPKAVLDVALARKDIIENGPTFMHQTLGMEGERKSGGFCYEEFLKTLFIPLKRTSLVNKDVKSIKEHILRARHVSELITWRELLGDPFIAHWRPALQIIERTAGLFEEEKKNCAVFERIWNAVCRIDIGVQGEATGVYVQHPVTCKTYLLTNWHVVNPEFVICTKNRYRALFFPKEPRVVPFYISCDSIFATGGGWNDKDWTFIDVTEDDQKKLTENGILPILLSQSSAEVRKDEWIMTVGFHRVELLIQDPCMRLLYPHYAFGVDRRWCSLGQVRSASGSLFTHDCFTLPGSSGSLILNRSGQVVGMHQRTCKDESSSRLIGHNDAVSCRSWLVAAGLLSS